MSKHPADGTGPDLDGEPPACAKCGQYYRLDDREPAEHGLCWPCASETVTELRAERDALQRFKDFVHRRLDTAGVPTHPDGPHSKEGCRIGDRLDLVIEKHEAELAKAWEAAATAQRAAIYDYIRIDWPGCLTCASLISRRR